MAEDRAEEAWLPWRSIPRLAASVASVPVVVGYASVAAALLLGRSVGEVLRGASWALDQIVRNSERSQAVVEGLRKGRKPAKDNRPVGAVGRSAAEHREPAPGGQAIGASPRIPEDTRVQGDSIGAPRLADALEGSEGGSQWIVWPDAACEVEWVGVTFNFDWPALTTIRS